MDESRSLQDGEAMDVASDGGQSQTPAPPVEAQARPVEPLAPPAPAPAAPPVAPASAPVAARPVAPSMPPPPPPPPPATLAAQQAPAPQQQAPPPQQAAPSSQPWEEDDSGMWTESDWDKILQLTQAPAGTTAAAAPAAEQTSQASQPPPTPALPSQYVLGCCVHIFCICGPTSTDLFPSATQQQAGRLLHRPVGVGAASPAAGGQPRVAHRSSSSWRRRHGGGPVRPRCARAEPTCSLARGGSTGAGGGR